MSEKRALFFSLPPLFGLLPGVRRSLSTKLLTLTIIVVLLTEIVIMIPSVAHEQASWLRMRANAAYLVGLAVRDENNNRLDKMLVRDVLSTADIKGLTLERNGRRELLLSPDVKDPLERIRREINLTDYPAGKMISDAWATVFSSDDSLIRVISDGEAANGVATGTARISDIIISRVALRSDLRKYARNILILSLIISSITAIGVFFSINRLAIAPVKRMRENMSAFEADPENRAHILTPGSRVDEIGDMEQDLSALEWRLYQLLNERRRLAALGAGISKISHDLRNILASAQLMSDRLANSDDPRVKKLSPRLVNALDRAIALSRDTLSYGRISPETIKKSPMSVRPMIDEIIEDHASIYISMENTVPESFTMTVDKNHFHRAANNIIRNAYEALLPADLEVSDIPGEPAHTITISAGHDDRQCWIEIADTGPGMPEEARRLIDEPFKGSFKPGGSGLGLAISAEIMRAHGGALTLVKSDDQGTTFRLSVPE